MKMPMPTVIDIAAAASLWLTLKLDTGCRLLAGFASLSGELCRISACGEPGTAESWPRDGKGRNERTGKMQIETEPTNKQEN